jgi:proteasome accessory factor B
MAANSPAAKTERLMNLVLCLLYTRRPLEKSRIRQMVEQYHTAPTDEAFDRMFERDKDELRELGIPLVTEDIGSVWDDEPGYRIHERDYALPDVTFEPDELAVLGLASRTWAHASLAGPAAQALRKLNSSGVERDPEALIGIEPRLRTTEPAFDAVKDAVLRQVPIEFGYRTGGSSEVRSRHVQPWGLASWRGRWYLTGFDTDREAPRVFRLSRMTGDVRADGAPGSFAVPEGHRPEDMIDTTSPDPTRGTARVRVAPGRGHVLRRRAGRATERDDGWTDLEVPLGSLQGLADDVAWYGKDVVAVSPPELVDAVVGRLTEAARIHEVAR